MTQLQNTTGQIVTRLAAYNVPIPLKKKIAHASHERTSSDNLLVTCELSDGTIGFGEGVPRSYVTGETIEQSLDMVRNTNWSTQLTAVRSFADVIDMIKAIKLTGTDADPRQCFGNAARCAVELALLDAFGKHFKVPLRDLITLLPGTKPITAVKDRCRYSGAITSGSDRKETGSAWKQRIFGFQQMKIKVGTSGQDDLARLKKFRGIFGKRVDLRIDANEAWSPSEVVARIKELEPFGITSVEQPVKHEEIACLREVRKQINTPIMHDESLCSFRDGQVAIAEQTCDLFNLRISKCGGMIATLELARLAHENGLGYQLGCQVGETGILSAAGRAIACSLANIRYLEGSYDSHLVKERLTLENLTFGWGGRARALNGFGLGVNVDHARIKQLAQDSFSWER